MLVYLSRNLLIDRLLQKKVSNAIIDVTYFEHNDGYLLLCLPLAIYAAHDILRALEAWAHRLEI